MNYPEHQKLEGKEEEHFHVMRFLQWLEENGLQITASAKEGFAMFSIPTAGTYPAAVPMSKVLNEFFDLDEVELEKERRQMLDDLRNKKQ